LPAYLEWLELRVWELRTLEGEDHATGFATGVIRQLNRVEAGPRLGDQILK